LSHVMIILYLFHSLSPGVGSNYNAVTDALQSSSSFPSSYRHNNAAHHYLEEGHPFTIDPNSFDIGSSMGLSDEMRFHRPDGGGIMRTVQASIETHVSRDYMYQFDYSNTQIEEHEDTISQPQRRAILQRKRSRLAPHLLSSSILPTRRNSRKTESSSPSDLLTFEEEKEIAGDIQNFRAVTRARDNLAEWMSREVTVHRGAGGGDHIEPSEYQLASSCSLTVDQLRDVIARGQEARTKLIRGNVGLVTMISKRYYNMLRNGNGGIGRSTGAGATAGGTDATLKLDDLIQEGYMGIMEAAERFNPEKGFRFSTYATHWIRQRIVRSIAESSRTIRLPIHVQTIIRNMHKKSKELEATTGRRPSTPELAHELGVPLDKIHLYQHLSKQVLSLEHPLVGRSNTENKRTLGDRVACTEVATPEEFSMSEDFRGEVHAMLDGLRHDERLVLTHRFGLDDGRPKSLRETAEGLGVSSDRVRTVEAKALNKLRNPQMNYRLKDYVGRPEVGLGGESEVVDHGFMLNSIANFEEQPQKNVYQYPFQTSSSRVSTMDNVVSDDEFDEYGRPTPESIWSF